LDIEKRGYLGYGNLFKGSFLIFLKENVAIGNRNVISLIITDCSEIKKSH
jgi:hypothetical protein